MNLGLAMNNFARDRGRNRYPAAAIRKDGKPLLSWRVALLPFLGEQGSMTSSTSTSHGTARTTWPCWTRCLMSTPPSQ